MVTANTFRHPALLAKIATTVDVISRGRVEVGLGAGWFEEEHRQYGLPLPPLGERMTRLEESCRVLEALWTQKRATFTGTYYQVREAYHEPKPVQRPHPPLTIGTSGDRVGLRIAARHAQTWNMARATPEEFARKSALLDGYCREIGRDPAEIERSIQFLPEAMGDDIVARARDFLAAGATHLIFSCPIPYTAAGVRKIWDDVVTPLR
jgi:alkanesulfonate monooxygenase SsuD/methylene tetrahydromethanopterin reductase-like flavin-dependent oxidoreductase (luciferase family)